MATRSMIGMQTSDGKVKAIYCHYDGYPEHHVPILNEHYSTREQVESLIALGDLLVLGSDLGELGGGDSCIAYGRDRGERGTEAREFVNLQDLLNRSRQSYNYVWNDGKWLMNAGNGCSWTSATTNAAIIYEMIDN
jgi:hypothetical protein